MAKPESKASAKAKPLAKTKPSGKGKSRVGLVAALLAVCAVIGVFVVKGGGAGLIPQATETKLPVTASGDSTLTATPKLAGVNNPNSKLTPKPKQSPTAKTSPKPEVTKKPVAMVKPKPVASPKPKPVASAKPKPVASPKPVATAKPKPVVTAKPKPVVAAKPPTPALVATNLNLGGKWSVGGIEPGKKQRVDREVISGFKLVSMGPTWGRLEKDGVVVLVGLSQPAKFATGFASETLFVDGKQAVSAGTDFKAFEAAKKSAEASLNADGIQGLPGVKGAVFFQRGEIDAPMPGQVSCTQLINSLEARDLAAFKSNLDKTKANIKWNNGKSLLAYTAGHRTKGNLGPQSADDSPAEFCRALLEAGADAKTQGPEAFWSTEDIPTIAVLLEAGVPVNSTNEQGRNRLFLKDQKIYDYLVSKGADPNLKDKQGVTAKEFRAKFVK